MKAEDLPPTHKRVHSGKDLLHQQLQQALVAAGLGDFAIDSLRLYLKRGEPDCPNGSPPEWEPEVRPDGSVIYRYVCKP